MNKKEVKEIIENHEYNYNGLSLINGASVDVVNIKINKRFVYADVKLNFYDNNKKERYNDVAYPISMFNIKKEE
jgi:hypothetical protein